MVIKNFVPPHFYKNFNFQGRSSLVQSFLLRLDFFHFPDNKTTSICSCHFPLLKSLSSLEGPPQILYLSRSTLPVSSTPPK